MLPLYVQLEGDILFAKQNYPAALACYEKVNASQLASAETFYSTAKTKELMKAPVDEVLALMDSCMAYLTTPYTADAAPYLLERARVRVEAGKARDAVQDYNAYYDAVNGQVNDVFYYWREQAALKARLYQIALDDLAKAIELAPNDLTYRAELAVVMLVTIPLLVIAIGVLMSMCNRLFQVLQKRIDALNGTIQENLVAIRVVKAFVREGYEKTKFKASNDALTKATINVDMRVIAMIPIMMMAMNGATAAVLYLGGGQVIGGEMLIGDLSSFINYIFQILMSVMMLGMSFLQLSRSIACARRINEVLETEPSIEDGPLTPAELPEAKGKVEFQNVDFKYDAGGTGENVLSGIDLTIQPGEFIAVVGGTGTGKSSLVNLIPRFYDVSGGAVLLDGVDVRDYPLEALRSRIGMVLQNNVLFTGTIRENLLWGRADATEEEMIQAAKNAQAYDFVMAFPDGFDTQMAQGGTNVSGGQKQRLCIARAMLRHPAVLILDDSTSAVDTATDAKIRQSFKENLAGTTVIIIAQRISSVMSADRILVLDDGKIADMGTHDELMARCGIYQEIYQSQQEGVQE